MCGSYLRGVQMFVLWSLPLVIYWAHCLILMVFPQCLACLTSEQCVSWCIHICFPLPILIHETTQWSLKSQDVVIIEIEKMCIFSYSFLFQLLLQLYVNQFKQLCFQNRVNRNGTVIYGKQHNPIVNWKFNPMITAFFPPSLSFWNPKVHIYLVLDLQHQDDVWNKYLGR